MPRFIYARNRWLAMFKSLRALFGPAAAMRYLDRL